MAIAATRARSQGAPAPAPRVHVVPHAHWDLEWYLTYESFQARLGRLMSTVLDAAADDSGFTFMPDGQVAMVDAHLELHPADERRIRAAVARGALVLGPWYTLSDQFLVSGETTVRNLELGMRRARELGGSPMMAGYCPDQFGQAAQTPQILAMLGIRRAVAMRGVPDRIASQRFHWTGLDGTTVETLHLGTGYYHLGVLDDPEKFGDWLREAAAQAAGGAGVLLLCGDDHRTRVSLPAHVLDAGGRFSTLERYWDSLPPLDAGAPRIEGELRTVGRESLTTNVVSNRVDVRLATAAAERALERYAEPLASFCSEDFPHDALDRAWHHLIRNAAHDSICATSVDDVVDAVLVRARAARDLARGVVDDCLATLAPRLAAPGLYVWNPSPWPRTQHVVNDFGQVLRARAVPPLGWAPLVEEPIANPVPPRFELPPLRVLDQPDRGDTYNEDCDPQTVDVSARIPVAVEWRAGDSFARLRVQWVNRDCDHRVRLHIALPREAATCIADTPFGAIERPAVPEVRWGKDRASGYPAGRFVVAGGIAVLVDRVAEFELLPETGELAITLLRSVGALSRAHLRTRPYAAGPVVPSWRAQLLGEHRWDLALLPWESEGLPWREWEQFVLPMPVLAAPGGGELPPRGTPWPQLPDGNLSAVLPDRIRVFDPGPPWKIRTEAMRPQVHLRHTR